MLTDTTNFHRRALLIAGLAFVLVFIIWNVEQASFLAYPFRLFVTFVHESGHGLAAIISGGQLQGFVVSPDGTGYATTSGGNIALILPAGYLGAALFGALLFYVTNTVRHTRVLAVVLGLLLAIFTVLYTGILSTAGLVGGIGSGLLLYLGWRGSQIINLLVLNLLALMSGLHAVLDLVYLIGNSGVQMGEIRNDAAAFSVAVTPLIPPGMWAALWALAALIMLGIALYYSVIRRLWAR